MTPNRWTLILILTCIALAVVMQIPQILHMRHPLYQGRLIELNDDEPAYLARVEEALTGRPEQVEEAFVGDPKMVGMHFAFIEQMYGYLFSWTGLHAPVFLQIEDSVIPVLLFLALYFFFRLCGFPRARSYGGCLVFLLVSLYYLDRPINQRTTSLFMMMALLSVILALERHVLFAVIAGVLLAILLDVYFWSWTFAYAFCVLLLLTETILWKRSKNDEEKRSHLHRIRILLTIAAITIVAAIPMYIKVWNMLHHPMIDAGNFRAAYTHSRLPVSWPYSILFFGMTIGALVWTLRNEQLRKKPYAMLMILTGFVVMHQQVIHGVEFRTVAGYQFPHIFAAITALLLGIEFFPRQLTLSPSILRTRKGWLQAAALIPLLFATIFLLGKLVDNHRVVRQWVVLDGSFSDQHLATSLPYLRSLSRSRIVSSTNPSHFLASYTHHDIVYSYFLKNVLISEEELAERWCLNQLGFPVVYRNISPASLLHNDTTRLKDGAKFRAEEERLVQAACLRIEKQPEPYLEKYDVDYFLWDERFGPTMKLEQYGEGLTKVAEGDGWSLWKIPRETTN